MQILPTTPSPPPELIGARVLVVASDAALTVALTAKLSRAGATVVVVGSGEAARRESRNEPGFDGALIDSNLPEALPSLVSELQGGDRACAVVGLLRQDRVAGGGDLAGSSASELLQEPWRAIDVVAAAGRASTATRRLRGTCLRMPSHPPPREAPCSLVPELESAVTALGEAVRLSPRELGVLRLLAMGYRYEDVGRELEISPRTVKMHAANLRRKTGVATRQQLLAKVFQS